MIEPYTEQNIGRRWMPLQQQHLPQMTGQLQLALVQISLESGRRNVPYPDLNLQIKGIKYKIRNTFTHCSNLLYNHRTPML